MNIPSAFTTLCPLSGSETFGMPLLSLEDNIMLEKSQNKWRPWYACLLLFSHMQWFSPLFPYVQLCGPLEFPVTVPDTSKNLASCFSCRDFVTPYINNLVMAHMIKVQFIIASFQICVLKVICWHGWFVFLLTCAFQQFFFCFLTYYGAFNRFFWQVQHACLLCISIS